MDVTNVPFISYEQPFIMVQNIIPFVWVLRGKIL